MGHRQIGIQRMAYFDDAGYDEQQDRKEEGHLDQALPSRRFEGVKASMDEFGQSFDFHDDNSLIDRFYGIQTWFFRNLIWRLYWFSTTAPVTASIDTV
jgi:hypothetical protein